MEPDDPTIIAEVLRGDTSAFETLVIRYQRRIFGSVRRYAQSESDTEDIVQQVFVKAFTKLASYRGDAPFEHWLMRLSVRTCLDFLRSQRRKPEILMSQLSEAETALLDRGAIDSGQDQQNSAAACELVQRLLDHLPPPYRIVITLLEIEERSVKEIAQLTGWSIPLIKVRAFRARRQMRQWLERMADSEFHVTRRA
jgi:RNA polymerase sigma-70 factor, ECF subfamily